MILGLLLASALSVHAQTEWPDGVPPIPAGVVVEPELHCRPEVIDAMKKAWGLVPNYVVSGRGLAVTVLGTKRWKSVRRAWNRPCE